MRSFQLLLIVALLMFIAVLGIFASEQFVTYEESILLVACNAVVCCFALGLSPKSFKEALAQTTLPKFLFGFEWNNLYQLFLLFAIPVCWSISLLTSGQLVAFTLIFSFCYFQNLLLIYLYKLFSSKISDKLWRFYTIVLFTTVVLANETDITTFILFNPFLSLSFLPYCLLPKTPMPLLIVASCSLTYMTIFILSKATKKS